jgi:hypothetical protein
MRNEDHNRYTQFKTAQKVLDKVMMAEEQQLSSIVESLPCIGLKRKQTVLDLTSQAKRL